MKEVYWEFYTSDMEVHGNEKDFLLRQWPYVKM